VYRPYFYDECGYDKATRSCTSEHHDARRSFPSGHAGLARALRLVCAACYMIYPSCGMACCPALLACQAYGGRRLSSEGPRTQRKRTIVPESKQ
jgi:hypothetical protein